MSQIEIVQYQGESPREKRKGEQPERTGKVIEFWNTLEQVYAPPPHDPATQKVVLVGYAINGGNWEAQYSVVDLSAEEIARRAEQTYLGSLDWSGFETSLLQPTVPDSAYSQLTTWAKQFPAFADTKININGALIRRNHSLLLVALADLKQQAIAPTEFSPAQIAEIETCLQILGVNWSWADL